MKILVDFSTLNAVESLFRPGPKDPWATRLAGQLADVYAYATHIETPWPTHDGYERAGIISPGTSLGELLLEHDRSVFAPKIFRTDNVVTLREEFVGNATESLALWAPINRHAFRRWIQLHGEQWIRDQNINRVRNGTVYRINEQTKLASIDSAVDLPQGSSLYALDIILRYPFYGSLTPAGGFYLNHPIRDAFSLPGVSSMKTPPAPIAVSFDASLRELVPHLDLIEYVALLHEIRRVVAAHKLDKLAPGQVDRDVLRAIASDLRLPPKLRGQTRRTAAATAVIGGLGAIPALGAATAIGGAIVGVAAAYWDGRLPRGVAHWSWLRWAIEWEIEQQADDRDGP